MNWYKKSKLVDKEEAMLDRSMYVKCQNCDRYATENPNNPEKPIWKTFEEMNPQEKIEFEMAEQALKEDIGSVVVSHGICNFCWEDWKKQIGEYVKDKKVNYELV